MKNRKSPAYRNRIIDAALGGCALPSKLRPGMGQLASACPGPPYTVSLRFPTCHTPDKCLARSPPGLARGNLRQAVFSRIRTTQESAREFAPSLTAQRLHDLS